VFTVVTGVRRARRELLEAEDQITTLKAERASRLAELGRAAVSDDRFDQTAIRSSRDLLTDIEDRRSRHAGAAAAADAELDAIDRARQSQLNKLADEVAEAEADVQRLDAEIAPLERESAAARKRAAAVKETLSSIDTRIAAARASLVSVKGPQKDRAAVEAELATLRADRASVSRDEPAIAAELDALLPRIANLESQRADAQARITAARAGDAEARMRAEEQVTAVQARRRVENRAAADARTASERALIELGERLYVERPDDLTIKLGAVDKQDVSIATSQRRAIELRELIGSVDRAALARGIALWVAIVGAVITTVVLVLT
jgi:chromosome segregation ATPase